MERRIDGARIIDSICRVALINKTLTTTGKDGKSVSLTQLLLQELRKHDILDRYYSKRNVHSELIQRSVSVLKVLFSDPQLAQDQLDMIWTSVEASEYTKIDFYNVLKDIASAISPSILHFFISKISKVPAGSLKPVELELMSQIIAGQKKDDAAGKVNTACGLEFFWNYLEK